MRIVADAQIPFIEDYFRSYGDLILKPGRTIAHADVKNADLLIVRSVTQVNKELLENTSVRFVGSVTAGADHLDTDWLDKVNIKWSVASGFNAPPVADYVVCVIAALHKYLQMQPVNVAVIGVGHVGRKVSERFKLLGFNVTLCDPIRALHEEDFTSVPLQELSNMDLISLHVPLTKTGNFPTYHFINQDFLSRQKPDTILLNVSRGNIINSNDLLAAGKHLKWCFDVWEHEPIVDKAIVAHSVIATPHIAGYSVQSKMRGIDMIYRIASEQHLIPPKRSSSLMMPNQTLSFSGQQLRWQEIVLGVFNPLIISSIMRSKLLAMEDDGTLFDEMRHQFNYRHEFAFTTIEADVVAKDKELLEKFGMNLTPP